ncbi:MAG TPA: carbohydrate ABC transporter permease [Armatimonadota bacterium]|jgi:ABC-type glycerol-3-phosphate transport system permease component
MPIIDQVGQKKWSIRLLLLGFYLILALLGVTMVYPFLMTITASVSTSMDYNRFAPLPRTLWSHQERFVQGIVPYFPDTLRGGMDQFAHYFVGIPSNWTTWQSVGDDPVALDKFANHYLELTENPATWEKLQRQAADYDAFAQQYPIADSLCAFNEQRVGPFFRTQYMDAVRAEPSGAGLGRKALESVALDRLNTNWELPFGNFYEIRPKRELKVPWDQRLYVPLQDGRERDFATLRQAYRTHVFAPSSIRSRWRSLLGSPTARHVLGIPGAGGMGLAEFNTATGMRYRGWSEVPFPVPAEQPGKLQALWHYFTGTVIPVSETRPFSIKIAWLSYLGSAKGRKAVGMDGGGPLTLDEYNTTFGTRYTTLRDTPCPVPATAPATLRQAWEGFVLSAYPMRLITVTATPEQHALFCAFVKKRFLNQLALCNTSFHTQYTSWEQIPFTATMPITSEAVAGLWMEYVNTLPFAALQPQSSEQDYQAFLLRKYGSIQGVNAAYGWQLQQIQQAQIPYDIAYLVTFEKNGLAMYWASLTDNYAFVWDYLILRGSAVWNTLLLILLTLLAALTVNPLAAYALSRFRLKQMPAIILFMLATMAFPAAVSVIPGYLLMRDLHMLNTYAALILPGIANGMSIFLLKGFFDSLPPELYEAASLDGAKEWQMFMRITLPLSKPILAVIALNSFIAAYNGWEWAMVVCQNPKMWTLAVWLYQFNILWAQFPWVVMAAFIMASIPTFLVFLLCQNVIMKGIILPQMK